MLVRACQSVDGFLDFLWLSLGKCLFPFWMTRCSSNFFFICTPQDKVFRIRCKVRRLGESNSRAESSHVTHCKWGHLGPPSDRLPLQLSQYFCSFLSSKQLQEQLNVFEFMNLNLFLQKKRCVVCRSQCKFSVAYAFR